MDSVVLLEKDSDTEFSASRYIANDVFALNNLAKSLFNICSKLNAHNSRVFPSAS